MQVVSSLIVFFKNIMVYRKKKVRLYMGDVLFNRLHLDSHPVGDH
jgi:hypothetical protein